MQNIEKNLHDHKARLLDINSCKDESLRKIRLEALQTDMETCYGIPKTGMLRITAFAKSFPDVFKLYQQIKNEEWS